MSDFITDILTRFPNCRITINGNPRPSRPKPREYDEKVTKSRGVLIRLQLRDGKGGQIGSSCVRNGRPVWQWVRESDLDEYHRQGLKWARMMRRGKEQS
jgi:hypothetical protein